MSAVPLTQADLRAIQCMVSNLEDHDRRIERHFERYGFHGRLDVRCDGDVLGYLTRDEGSNWTFVAGEVVNAADREGVTP